MASGLLGYTDVLFAAVSLPSNVFIFLDLHYGTVCVSYQALSPEKVLNIKPQIAIKRKGEMH